MADHGQVDGMAFGEEVEDAALTSDVKKGKPVKTQIKPAAQEAEESDADNEAQADLLRQQIQDDIIELRERIRPLNILILGKPGQGKSAFLMSCVIAILKKWGQYVVVGQHGGTDRAYMTINLRRINILDPKEGDPMIIRSIDSDPHTATLKEHCPRFIDIAGLPDENNKVIREVLRRILYGGIPEGTSLLQVMKEAYENDGVEKIRKKYWKQDSKLAIDRVVVVMSTVEDHANELVQALLHAAQPKGIPDEDDGFIYKRAVPVFGLITMMDKKLAMSPNELERCDRREKRFTASLGIKGATYRLGRCTNYTCDDARIVLGKERLNDPKRDCQILTFLDHLFDPTLRVENEFDVPTSGDLCQSEQNLPKTTATIGIVGIILMCVVAYIIGLFLK